MSETVVFAKQSGELLSGSGMGIDDDAVRSAAKNILEAHETIGMHDGRGLVLVSGAGNLCRGGNSRLPLADARGRIATIMNVLALQDGLNEVDVPVTTLLAPSMGYDDAEAGTNFRTFTPEAVHQAHELGHVVLLGGGMGRDNETTDSATARAGAAYLKTYNSATAVVVKSTQFDGVFDRDPALDPQARRYKTIGAPQMAAEYSRFKVVDRTCLDVIMDSGLQMRIFAGGQHMLSEVVEASMTDNQRCLGTLVMPRAIEAEFYPPEIDV